MEALSQFLKNAGKYKLLKKDEERFFLEQFFACQDLLNIIVELNLKNPKTTRKLKVLTYQLLKLKKKIVGYLVERNIRLVVKIAKGYIELGLPLEDLIDEGILGLIHAIELFKLDTGNKLSTYATIWIKQYIGRALENKSRVVRLPNNKLQLISKLKRIVRKHIEIYGEPPDAEEIAEAFARLEKPITISIDEVKELGRLQYGYTSLDESIGEDENLPMINYLTGDEKYQPEETVEKVIDQDYAHELLSKLTDEERQFIMIKFGFLDNYEKSYKEMTQFTKLSIKEIKDKEKHILDKLKKLGSKKKVNYLL